MNLLLYIVKKYLLIIDKSVILFSSPINQGGKMPAKLYHVCLKKSERQTLEKLTHQGHDSARRLNRARILLLSDESQYGAQQKDDQIASLLGISSQTVVRIRQRFCKEGLESAIGEKPRSGAPRKLCDLAEAHLTALACSESSQGHERWTLRMLSTKAVELGLTESISHVTIRNVLKKAISNPGKKDSGVSAP